MAALSPYELSLTQDELNEVEALEEEINAALKRRYDKEGPMALGEIICTPISVEFPLPKIQAELIRRYRSTGWHSASFDILPDGPTGSSWFDLEVPK